MSTMRNTAILTARWSTGRAVWASIFFAWGFGWLWVLTGDLFSLSFSSNVGVGTSSYIGAHATIWIGGLLLFGLAALMCPPKHDLVGVAQTVDADSVEYPQEHHGIPYRTEPDGGVVANTDQGPIRYRSWQEFWAATNRI